MDNRPIGVFDSGVGGLTVAKEIFRNMPNEEVVFFSDTIRLPYGSKSVEMLNKLSTEIVKFLLNHDAKAIVIACGTVSSNCYEYLVNKFDVDIIEIVTSGVKECLAVVDSSMGVIATEATIFSKRHEKIARESGFDGKFFSVACPMFVPIVEEGFADSPASKYVIDEYMRIFNKNKVDTILLGCTHYPLLKDEIQNSLTYDAKLIDCSEKISLQLKSLLESKNMLSDRVESPKHKFYCTGNIDKFNNISKIILGMETKATSAVLEVY